MARVRMISRMKARSRHRLWDDSVDYRQRPAPSIAMNFEGRLRYLNSKQRRTKRPKLSRRVTLRWRIGWAIDCVKRSWRRMAKNLIRWLWETPYWSKNRDWEWETLESQAHSERGQITRRPRGNLDRPRLVVVPDQGATVNRKEIKAHRNCRKWSKCYFAPPAYAIGRVGGQPQSKLVVPIEPVRKLFALLFLSSHI